MRCDQVAVSVPSRADDGSVIDASWRVRSVTIVHVTVVRWPEEADLRGVLGSRSVPLLLLVSPGAPPPQDLSDREDWVWSDARPEELHARLATLEARSCRGPVDEGISGRAASPAPSVDANDVLHVGRHWVALGPTQARLARVLIASPGEIVSRAAIERAIWGNAGVRPNTVDRQMHRLRRHLERVGLTLRTVRCHGYVLELH
jgi:hypothetical protein